MIRVTTELNPVPAEFNQNRNRAMRSFMDRMSAIGQKKAKVEAPKDTGLLINSIQIIRDFRPPVFSGGIETNLPYAIVQEEGRTPGEKAPPTFAIERWITRHRATFEFKGAKELRSLAFVVARSIGKKGFKGKFFFKAAEKAMRKKFSKQIKILGLQIQTAWESGG